MSQSTVSIVIPCYNGEQFIDHSIRSVWEQDYPHVELIVVNDGSEDRTGERILAWKQSFADKGWELKYLYQDNQGQGVATDRALKHVTGEYLTLLDADDVYLPGAIRKKAEFLDAHPDYAGVRNNGILVKAGERSLFMTSDEERGISDLFTALTFGRTNNWAGTYMVRTSILFDFYPDRCIDPSRLGQNFQILLPVAYDRKFGYIDEPLMEYRVQADSHSQASDLHVWYRKNRENSIGWRNIYRNIVIRLIGDPERRAYYLNAYDSVFYRSAMNRAVAYHHATDARENYKLLKKTGYLTLDDRINCAKILCPILALGLRLIRKIRSLICKQK